MTTRRNNMFYYRGACSAYSTILRIMKEIESDEERIATFKRFYKSWLEGAKSIVANKEEPEIDSCTIFTEHFYVTIEDGDYKIVDKEIDGDSFNRMILWNENTRTNYIIDFTGDWDSVIDFIKTDNEFMVNLPKSLGLNPDEVEEIDRTKLLYISEDKGVWNLYF